MAQQGANMAKIRKTMAFLIMKHVKIGDFMGYQGTFAGKSNMAVGKFRVCFRFHENIRYEWAMGDFPINHG